MDWPAELPQSPLIDGFGYKPKNNVLRTAMDVGPHKTRRISTARTIDVMWPTILSAEQMEVFDDFFENDTLDGSLPFNIINPRTGLVVEARIVEPPEPEFYSHEKARYVIKMEFLP